MTEGDQPAGGALIDLILREFPELTTHYPQLLRCLIAKMDKLGVDRTPKGDKVALLDTEQAWSEKMVLLD